MNGSDVIVRTQIEREVVVDRDERIFTIRAPLQSGLIPHSLKLYYTVSLSNVGDEPATNVICDNPIPAGTDYVIGSATTPAGVVSISVDGVSFHSESELPDSTRCTHLRWLISEILPRDKCDLCFEVVVTKSQEL